MRASRHFINEHTRVILASIAVGLAMLVMLFASQSHADSHGGSSYRIGARITSFVGTSPRDAELAMKLIIEELLDDPLYQNVWDRDGVHFEFFRTREEFIKAQSNGGFDFLVGSTIDLIDTIDALDHDKFYTFDIGGQTASQYILITNASSKFDSLESLTDARIVAPKGGEIGLMWMETMLTNAGVDQSPQKAQTLTPTVDYIDGINKVYFDQGDVALATREALAVAIELNPQLMDSLKILGESEPLLTTIAVPTVLPPAANEFDRLIRSVHERKSGQSVLRLFRCNQIRRGDPSELDSIRRLAGSLESAT